MSDKAIEIGQDILHADDLTKEVVTKRGTFTIKVLNPMEKRQLIRRIAVEAGAPIDNLAAADYMYLVATLTVQVVIKDAPEWWKGTQECYDEDLIFELYNAYNAFETEFRSCLRQGKYRGSDTK